MSEHSHDDADRQSPAELVPAEEIRAFTEGRKRAAHVAKHSTRPPPAVRQLEPSPASDPSRRPEQFITAAHAAVDASPRARAATVPPPSSAPAPAFVQGMSQGARIEAARERRQETAKQRRDRARRANERLAARVHAELGPILKARGAELTVDQMVLIEREVWHTSWAIKADATGRAVWAAFRNVPAAQRAHMLTLALGIVDGRARYRFSDERARAVAAVCYVLIAMAKTTKRGGPFGGGLVMGITRNAFCALLRDVNDPRGGVPCLTTVFGTHVPGNGRSDRERLERPWELGYMTVLKLGKFCYSQQLPSADAEPCERWGTYTSARYWLGAWQFETIYRRTGSAVGGLMELATVWLREGLEAALQHLATAPPDTPAVASA